MTNRLLTVLIATQLLAFMGGWGVGVLYDYLGIGHAPEHFNSYAIWRTRQLVISSLKSDGAGFVRIEPSDALLAEMKRNPSLRFAVFDPDTKRVARGSSGELVADFQFLARFKSRWAEFSLPESEVNFPQAHLAETATPSGSAQVLVYGYKVQPMDFVADFVEVSKEHVMYLLMPLLVSIPALLFVVRNSLRPLFAFSEVLRGVDLDSLERRLPDRDYPSELAPLVRDINGTLDRLRAGATTLRRFTANAAHELRTPVSILNARLDAPESDTFKLDIKRDVRRIRNIVEQLLAIARAPSSSDEAHQEIDLVAVAKSTVSDIQLLAYRSGRRLDVHCPEGPVLVRADRVAVESVISNLVENALRSEPEGGAVLVGVNDNGTITVTDHGEGIAEADRELTFEPFWRKRSAGPGGAGLGLAISKELIEKYGGRILIEETPGGGATFKVSLNGGNARA